MNTPQPLPPLFAVPHAWARRQSWLHRFTWANRLLLAMAFLPTGMVKATGQRFTILPINDPVGFFFEAMYRTGPYWHFIGIMQMVAAVLLLIPATAAIGALVFLPIGISIFLVTWGIHFQGTVWITAGMLLSVIYLICWDGDRIWAAGSLLLGRRIRENQQQIPRGMQHPFERVGWIIGGAAGMGLVATTRGFVPRSLIPMLLFAGLGAAGMVVVGWILGARTGPPA